MKTQGEFLKALEEGIADALGFLLGGGLLPALLLAASDGSLRYSLHNTGVELLYVPIAREARGSAKRLADIFGRRGGQVVASLAILVVAARRDARLILAAGISALALVWIGLAFFSHPRRGSRTR